MLVFVYLIFVCFGEPWNVISPKGVRHNYPQQLQPQEWLVEQNTPFALPPQTDISKFITQCIQTRDFLQHTPQAPLGILEHWGYTKTQRIDALTKIIETGTKNLLLNVPKFLASFLEWVFLVPLFIFFLLKDGDHFKFF